MKYAYWGFAMLLFGSIGLVIIVMFETITLNNDSEYYVLKEAMEAAMLESVDLACYRINDAAVSDGSGCNGDLKMSEQKFVENFTRRFVASIKGEVDEYTIEFYDVMEMPPKATVVVKSKNTNYSLVSDEINIYNSLSGILEARNDGGYKVTVNEEEDDVIINSGVSILPESSYTIVDNDLSNNLELYPEDSESDGGNDGTEGKSDDYEGNLTNDVEVVPDNNDINNKEENENSENENQNDGDDTQGSG